MTGPIDTLLPRRHRNVAGRSELARIRPLPDSLSLLVPLVDGPGDRVLGTRFVGFGSALIRRDMLCAIRRRAERT